MNPDGFVDPRKKIRLSREAEIEEYGCDAVRSLNGLPYKFVSPQRNGVPDRLNLFPIPPGHRELISRYVTFIEYKRPGEFARPEQLREHETLRKLGFKVIVIDTKAGVDEEFRGPFNNRRA